MKFQVALITGILLLVNSSPGIAAIEAIIEYDLTITKECIEGRFGCSNAPAFDFEYQASQNSSDPVISFQLAPGESRTFTGVVNGAFALAREYVPSGWTLVEIEIILSGNSNQILYPDIIGGDGQSGGIRYSGSGTTAPTELIFRNTRNVSAVPTPAAAWLFGSGLIALAGLKRRKP